MNDLSPRVDRCKPCGRATVHHYTIAMTSDDRWWACCECDAQRPTLTRRARPLTPDEDTADVAKHLARARAMIAAHEVTP